MSDFVTNPIEFSAECVRDNGQCVVDRKNIIFLDDAKESAAIAQVQEKCGYVVIIPDTSNQGQALLYHTSCQRMTDVVSQIFQDSLQAPVSLPQQFSEITVGELHRRRVTLPYDDCKLRVAGFSF
jgi:fibrillarin-like rRNA methylase